MPADHGVGLHDVERAAPMGPEAGEQDPIDAIPMGQAGALAQLALEEGHLVMQGFVFEAQLGVGSGEEGAEQQEQDGSKELGWH